MSDQPAVEFLTISQAAQRLGVADHRLRHVVQRSMKRLENVPETRDVTLQTRTGERSATAYPAEWILSLMASGEAVQVSHGNGERSKQTQGEHETNATVERSSSDVDRLTSDGAERSDWRTRAMIAEALLAEVRGERDEWRRQAQESIGALREEQSRTAVLLAAAAQGRVMLTSRDQSDDTEASQAGQGSEPENRVSEPESRPEEPPRKGWLSRLFGGR